MKSIKISLVAAVLFCSFAASAQIYRTTPVPSQRIPANRLPASSTSPGQIGTVPAGNPSPRTVSSGSAMQDISSGGVPPKTYVPASVPQTVILPQTTLPVGSYPAGTVAQPATEEQTQTVNPASPTPTTTAPGNANQIVPAPGTVPVLNGQQATQGTVGQPTNAPRTNVTTPAQTTGRPNQ
jgi:hypothetical protein